MRRKALLVVCIGTLASGCATLNDVEEQQYANLEARGAPRIERKSPTVAALLNILPGGGDVYNGEWGAFALDLLLWAPSILWAVPQGAITAENINKRATIAHYTVGAGKGQFDADTPPTMDTPKVGQ